MLNTVLFSYKPSQFFTAILEMNMLNTVLFSYRPSQFFDGVPQSSMILHKNGKGVTRVTFNKRRISAKTFNVIVRPAMTVIEVP